MSFLTFKPDLTGYAFSEQDLLEAQEGLIKHVDRVAPQWSENRTSPFCRRWYSDVIPQTLFLIDLWKTIRFLAGRVIPDHLPRLDDKMRSLIMATSEKQFMDNWAELQVGHMIASRAVPIEIEPLLSQQQYTSSSKPPSPDFGAMINDARTLFEATVIRVQSLDDYSSVYEYINNFFMSQLALGLSRSVDISIPFLIERKDVSHQQLRLCFHSIRNNEYGDVYLNMNGKSVHVQWRPLPFFIWEEGDPLPKIEGVFAALGSEGVEFGGGMGVNAHMRVEDGDLFVDKIRRSLTNTLRGKKRQLNNGMPSVLFLCLTQSAKIPEEAVDIIQELLDEEVYSKADYDWLSAVVIHNTKSDYSNNPSSSGTFSVNPNAEHLASQDLIDALRLEKTFFRWKYEFGRLG